MTPRSLVLTLLVAAVVVVGYLVASSGPAPYVIKIRLADADGLIPDGPVSIAGQDVGNISLGVSDDHVVGTINVAHKYGPIGRGAVASIDSVNLLGQKRIQITKGTGSAPAPNGYVLPAAQVSVSSDLNQVLDVLTPDVRARLAILINEAGEMMTGREADFSQTLEQLPSDLGSVTEVADAVASDNHTLSNLVTTSDGFVSELANNHGALVDAVNTVGQTAATLASRRRQLAATIGDAPQTLTNLDGFLVKLQNLTVPLAPAARDITATAPELDAALAQVGPFTSAADPDLRQATSDAPELTDLATGATPVLKTATPVVENLASLSQDLQPVSDTLSKSVDNLLAILQNWSRAIQFRDGLSHVFRGEASASPYTVTSLINQLEANPVLGSALGKLEQSLRRSRKVSGKSSAGTRLSAAGLSALLGGVLHTPAKHAGSGSHGTVTTPTTASSNTASTTTTTTTTTSGAGVGAGLSSLLNYLLK